jgi:hypothetical protein
MAVFGNMDISYQCHSKFFLILENTTVMDKESITILEIVCVFSSGVVQQFHTAPVKPSTLLLV